MFILSDVPRKRKKRNGNKIKRAPEGSPVPGAPARYAKMGSPRKRCFRGERKNKRSIRALTLCAKERPAKFVLTRGKGEMPLTDEWGPACKAPAALPALCVLVPYRQPEPAAHLIVQGAGRHFLKSCPMIKCHFPKVYLVFYDVKVCTDMGYTRGELFCQHQQLVQFFRLRYDMSRVSRILDRSLDIFPVRRIEVSLVAGEPIVALFRTPFLKCVASYGSKKNTNPNPSPTGYGPTGLGFGLCWFGAGGGGRTRTVSPPPDFESGTSANSITPALPVHYTRQPTGNQELFSPPSWPGMH